MSLENAKFGKWAVICEADRPRHWVCECECGKRKIVFEGSLRRGKSKSCGCETGRFEDLTGKEFGRLTVVKRMYEKENEDNHATFWLCRCECGREKVMQRNSLTHAKAKSCGKCNFKERNGNWKGGKQLRKTGYVLLSNVDHPNATKAKTILEHVFVMSSMLGRPLAKGEIVHHKNGIKHDNRPENLELCTVNTHIPGQRVRDLYEWAKQIVDMYGPLFEASSEA